MASAYHGNIQPLNRAGWRDGTNAGSAGRDRRQDRSDGARQTEDEEAAAHWPQDPEAEAAVLCSIFLSAEDPVGRNRALALVADRERLKPKHFRTLLHELVYKAMLELRAQDYLPDPMAVGGVLTTWGKLEEVGGQYAINRLSEVVQFSENARHYAERVRLAWCKRDILRLAALETANVNNPVKLIEIQAERAAVLAEMQPKRSMRLLTDIEAEQMKPSPAIIPKLLYANGVTMLYGDSDTYKTFLALSMALSIQTGCAWFGRTVERGQVVYVAGEAPNGIGKRLTAWKMEHGITGSTGFRLWTDPVNLMDPADVEVFISEVRAELGETMPTAVFFDTLAVCMGTGDPNKDQDVNAAYIGMRRVRDAFDGAAVLVVDHEGKDASRGMSGSSKKRNNADGVVSVARDGEGSPTITVKPTKCKDAKLPPPFRLTAEEKRWSTEDGEPRSSLVLVDAGDAPAASAVTRLTQAEQRCMEVFHTLHAAFPEQGVGNAEWERAFIEAGGTEGTFKKTLPRLRDTYNLVHKATSNRYFPTTLTRTGGIQGYQRDTGGIVSHNVDVHGRDTRDTPYIGSIPSIPPPMPTSGTSGTFNTADSHPGYSPILQEVEQTHGAPDFVTASPSPGQPTPTSNAAACPVVPTNCRYPSDPKHQERWRTVDGAWRCVSHRCNSTASEGRPHDEAS